jgi:hypothetical protein
VQESKALGVKIKEIIGECTFVRVVKSPIPLLDSILIFYSCVISTVIHILQPLSAGTADTKGYCGIPRDESCRGCERGASHHGYVSANLFNSYL